METPTEHITVKSIDYKLRVLLAEDNNPDTPLIAQVAIDYPIGYTPIIPRLGEVFENDTVNGYIKYTIRRVDHTVGTSTEDPNRITHLIHLFGIRESVD